MKKLIVLTKESFLENPIFFLTIIYFILASIIIPYFLSVENIANIILQSSDLIIIAIGLMFVLLNGGIDFAVITAMGLGGIAGASIMNLDNGFLKDSPIGFVVAIIVILGIGLIIGAINGFCVVKLKMPSFMATMAIYLTFIGITSFITNAKPINNLPEQFLYIGNGLLFGIIPVPIVIAFIVVLTAHIVLTKTVFGRNVYAVGTNPRAALISGLPLKRIIFSLFIICSVLASIGGIITMARLGAAKPNLNYERLMDFVTAVILGGTSLFGGTGTVIGTVVGCFFVSMLNNSLSMQGFQWYTILIVKGFFLLIVAIIDSIRLRKE